MILPATLRIDSRPLAIFSAGTRYRIAIAAASTEFRAEDVTGTSRLTGMTTPSQRSNNVWPARLRSTAVAETVAVCFKPAVNTLPLHSVRYLSTSR